jgi:hypothetical protein
MSSQEEINPKETARLIRQLGSILPRRRKQAEQQLIEQGTAVVPALVDAWRAANLRSRRSAVGSMAVYFGISLILWLVANIGLSMIPLARNVNSIETIGQSVFVISQVGYTAMMIIGLLLTWLSLCATRQSVGLSTIAVALADKRCINMLAERLAPEVRTAWARDLVLDDVRKGLAEALMQLMPADVNLLTLASRKTLLRWLRMHTLKSVPGPADADLSVAILRGLSVVGASDLRPLAEKILERAVTTEYDPRIQDEARLALDRLDEWAGRERSGAVLLRGSQEPTAADQVLLRAAGADSTSPAHLLRAHQPGIPEARISPETEEIQAVGTGMTSAP